MQLNECEPYYVHCTVISIYILIPNEETLFNLSNIKL